MPLTSRWPEIGVQSREVLISGLLKIGEEMQQRLILAMNEPKTGHTYHGHVASAPGEAPATDTGELESTITVEQESPLIVAVSANTPYAVALEWGTSKIAPRPNFGPRAEEMARVAPEILAAEFRKIK